MISIHDKNPSRQDIADVIAEGMLASDGNRSELQIVIQTQILQVLLDIRDIVEGLDRRMGAAAITNKVEKK